MGDRAPSPVDWKALGDAAVHAARHAYAPYSRFEVGAAGLTAAGELVTGCNVENASYGLTLCAECVLVGNQRLAGDAPLVAVACRSGDGTVVTPCGRCRQLLFEAGGGDLLVNGQRLADLLPSAFGPGDLP